MVLKVNDILKVGTTDRGSRYRILDITETKITYMLYYKNIKPRECVISKMSFEAYYWEPATLKWY